MLPAPGAYAARPEIQYLHWFGEFSGGVRHEYRAVGRLHIAKAACLTDGLPIHDEKRVVRADTLCSSADAVDRLSTSVCPLRSL